MNAQELDIDKLEAGPEMDAHVEEAVFRVRTLLKRYPDGNVVAVYPPFDTFGNEPRVPHYSTDIAPAWKVIEKLARKGILIWPEIAPSGNYGIVVRQAVFRELYHEWWEHTLFTVVADTAPLGICRAAYKVAVSLSSQSPEQPE